MTEEPSIGGLGDRLADAFRESRPARSIISTADPPIDYNFELILVPLPVDS